MNIVDQIFSKASPTDVALIANDTAWTFCELHSQVEAFSNCLGRLQLPPTARIGLLWADDPSYIIIALAVLKSGGCLVPIASELAPSEQLTLIQQTSLHGVITNLKPTWPDVGSHSCTIEESGICANYFRIVSKTSTQFSETEFSALNPAFVRFSSGTTGESKGIVLSHETLLERINAANQGLGITAQDRVLWILPMAHHFAVSIILYLWNGAATVLTKSHLAGDILETAEAHKASVIYGAPFHFRLLAADSGSKQWPSLRLAVSTASALRLNVAKAFEDRFGCCLTQGFGIIECGLPLLNITSAAAKPESIGRPLPSFTGRLVDETGADVPPGGAGELLLRGPGICDAYLRPWQTRAEFCKSGWFSTGDIARKDAEGDFFLLGRTRSVINVSGLKCFPEEIETVLNGFAGVKRSRVFGQLHPDFGTLPFAEIQVEDPAQAPTKSELLAHCRKHLARYKIPLVIQFVEDIPLTASGKIKRAISQAT
jgi:long-chain acyl-CoA synthetase